MRIVIFFGAAALLAACSSASTPVGGTCETQARAELNALQGAIQVSEQSISLGYSTVRVVSADGSQVEEARLPVNVARERGDLANMRGRLGAVQAEADAAVAACG